MSKQLFLLKNKRKKKEKKEKKEVNLLVYHIPVIQVQKNKEFNTKKTKGVKNIPLQSYSKLAQVWHPYYVFLPFFLFDQRQWFMVLIKEVLR